MIFELFTFEHPYSQRSGFLRAFPKPILRYILENSNVHYWKKLYQTCKYFYSLYPYIIVDYLDNEDHSENHAQNYKEDHYLYYNSSNNKYSNIQNLWLSCWLHCRTSDTFISEITPKVSKCNLFGIQLNNCILNETEFDFLTKWQKVKHLSLCNTRVMDSSNNSLLSLLPVENLISHVPNADFIKIYPCRSTPVTSIKLISLQRMRKFDRFFLGIIEGDLDAKMIFQFLKKNAGINAFCEIKFFGDPDYSKAFNDALKMELNQIKWTHMLEPTQKFNNDEIYDMFRFFILCINYIEEKYDEERVNEIFYKQLSKKHRSGSSRFWHFIVKKVNKFLVFFLKLHLSLKIKKN